MSPLDDLNEILAADGEPATCLEELERVGVDLTVPAAPPWSWDAIARPYALLDVDLARDMARGK